MAISKYLFVAGKEPKYVFYKTQLTIQKELFQMLKYLGVEDWKAEFDLAKQDELTISYILGIGWKSDGVYEHINALLFGESTFFLSDSADFTESNAVLGNVIGCIYDADTDKIKSVFEVESLKFPFSKINLEKLKKLQNEREFEFLHDVDDENDTESLSFVQPVKKTLSKFVQENENVFTVDWDDLDDLECLSQVWCLGLKLED